MRRSVIDVGSNSVLLTVSERVGQDWQVVFESTAVTSLGKGVRQTGLLAQEGIEQSLKALQTAFQDAATNDAGPPIAAATMAVRMAKNGDEFLTLAQQQGTPVAVLSGENEAQLGFEAVAQDPCFASEQRLSIVDVGGQSTEIVTAEREPKDSAKWNVLFRKSFPIGTLALLGDSLSQEVPDFADWLNAVQAIDECFGFAFLPGRSGAAVALGATGTNLISIREKLTAWDPKKVHGQWLDYEEVSKAATWLGSQPLEQRTQIVGLEKGREGTLHAGALILERALFALRTYGCYVSTRGWRHALLEHGEMID